MADEVANRRRISSNRIGDSRNCSNSEVDTGTIVGIEERLL